MRESIWRFFKKTKGPCYGFGYRAAMMLSAMFRLLLLALVFPVRAIRGECVGPRSSVRKWTAILSWSVGSQTWARR